MTSLKLEISTDFDDLLLLSVELLLSSEKLSSLSPLPPLPPPLLLSLLELLEDDDDEDELLQVDETTVDEV